MCAWVALTLPGTTGTPRNLYDSALAPAMIAEVDPRTMTLMALVDTASDDHAEPRRALALRTVTKVSGTPRTIGARVPSVAVGGKHRRGRDHWDQITPVPIAWATPSSRTRRNAERSIPEGGLAAAARQPGPRPGRPRHQIRPAGTLTPVPGLERQVQRPQDSSLARSMASLS